SVDGERRVQGFAGGPAVAATAALSPDGKWLAYASSEAGRQFQILVQPYPPTGAKYQITTENGYGPVWSPAGRRLYYTSSGTKLLATDVRTTPSFSFGKPMPLPVMGRLIDLSRNFDITPDGKQFLVVQNTDSASEDANHTHDQIDVVLNWFTELQQRVPAK